MIQNNFPRITSNLHLFSAMNVDFLNHCQKVIKSIIFIANLFIIERKIERERKTLKKLSASGVQNFRLRAER